MTEPELASLRALSEGWREVASKQGAIFSSGLVTCADELDAWIAVHQELRKSKGQECREGFTDSGNTNYPPG